MKLIVQIPCFNEEATLAQTIRDIPRAIAGVDAVEILIIDDGSTDRTVDVAREAGVDHIVRFTHNKGLARAFTAGLDAAVRNGADIIVNTDADNQYNGADIPILVQPILSGEAEMVVGDRRTDTIEHFSPAKKALQRFGSWVVRKLSDTEIPDTTSGFRAYSRDAALQLNIVSPFTYTLESIIQAGKKHITIVHRPVRTNEKLRESRLFRSIPDYIQRSAVTLVRMYTMFQPLRVFFYLGIVLLSVGSLGVLRFLYYYFAGQGLGHVQSLVLSGVLIVLAFILFMMGLVADLISFNRRLIEDALYRVKKIELSLQTDKETGRDRRG